MYTAIIGILLPSRPASPLRFLFRLKADHIVDGVAQSLLATDVALRRLNADMTEQELNLVQFASGLVAQPGTYALKVVGRNASQSTRCTCLLNNAPYTLGLNP